MKQRNYFYTLAILWSLLSCAPSLKQTLNPILWLILVSVCILAVWVITWLRLYTSQRMRPEFAILTVFPFLIYLYLIYIGQSLIEQMQAPLWGNLYFLTWLVAAFISSNSLKLTVIVE